MDQNGVISAIFDKDARRMRTVDVTGTAHVDPTPDDENGVWGNVFDASARALRIIRLDA